MGWVVSITPPPRFTPGERTPGAHWIGGWVGFRANLDTQAKGKILCLRRGSNPSSPMRSQTLLTELPELLMISKSRSNPTTHLWRPRGNRRYSSYSFMTSALDGVSGQRHAPAALYPQGKGPPVPIGCEAGWAPELVWTQARGKFLLPLPRIEPRRPVVQSIVRHYTDWATPAPNDK
jgi:hypothetical protein